MLCERVTYDGCLLIQREVVAQAIEHNACGRGRAMVAKNIVSEVAISGQQQDVLTYGSIKDSEIR